MDFYVFIRDSESAPLRYLDTVPDLGEEEGPKAIETARSGEGEYLAFPAESAVVRRIRIEYDLEELEA